MKTIANFVTKFTKGCLPVMAGVMCMSSQAFATPTFKGDTQYNLNGSIGFGTFGAMTFTSDSYLIYDTSTNKLNIDAKLTSSTYKNEIFDVDVSFGGLMLVAGATDLDSSSGVNVNFANGGSLAKFAVPPGVTKGSYTMVGTMSPETNFNYYNLNIYPVAAGFNFPMMVNMPAQIHADASKLYFDAWFKTWGDALFGGHPVHWDMNGDWHLTLTECHNTSVPEPMSMSLLATGLLGGAIARRRKARSLQ